MSRLILKQRVLIADYDTHFARRLSDYLWDHGYEARVVNTVAEARASVQSWQPQTVFVNLILPESNAISLLRFINSSNLKVKPQVTVMSKQALHPAMDEIRRCGGRYTLLKPFPLEDALRIVEFAVAPQVHKAAKSPGGSMKELHLMNLLLKQASISGLDGRLFNLLRMINLKVKAMRSSLIQCVDDKRAIVVASNDDENVRGLPLDLMVYPEIRAVQTSRRPLMIPNVRTSDLMVSVKDKLAHTPYETIVLFPVWIQGAFYGVLSLRMDQKEAVDMYYIEKFGEVCSQILALSIAHPERGAA